MKCNDFCDTENHHLHRWCDACEKRIDWEMDHPPTCKFGIGPGQIHPDMKAEYLINDVFWTEPAAVVQENEHFFLQNNNTVERVPKRSRNEEEEIERQHREHINEILKINERYQNELNGEGTSRTPLIESQEKLHNEKRFKNY